jgi:AraC-like DNA-binding protein
MAFNELLSLSAFSDLSRWTFEADLSSIPTEAGQLIDMAQQYAKDLSFTNSGLAKLVGLSVSAFERQFRLHLHTSPMQFHRKLRLARAAASLIQSPNSIAEIAQRFGFSDQAHLSRQFKEVYGSTPSFWRDKHSKSRQPYARGPTNLFDLYIPIVTTVCVYDGASFLPIPIAEIEGEKTNPGLQWMPATSTDRYFDG